MKAHGKVIQDTKRRIDAREHCIAILQEEVTALNAAVVKLHDVAKNGGALSLRDYVTLLSPMTVRERSALTRMLTMYKALPIDVDDEGARKAAELARVVEWVNVKESLAALADDGVTITAYQGRSVVRARDGKIIHDLDDVRTKRGQGRPHAVIPVRDAPARFSVVGDQRSTTRPAPQEMPDVDDSTPRWTADQEAALLAFEDLDTET